MRGAKTKGRVGGVLLDTAYCARGPVSKRVGRKICKHRFRAGPAACIREGHAGERRRNSWNGVDAIRGVYWNGGE